MAGFLFSSGIFAMAGRPLHLGNEIEDIRQEFAMSFPIMSAVAEYENRIYVSNRQTKSVNRYNLSDFTLVESKVFDWEPEAVFVDDEAGRLYITHHYQDSNTGIWYYDYVNDPDLTFLHRATNTGYPVYLARFENFLIASNYLQRTITFYDLNNSFALIRTITVGYNVIGVAVNAAARRLYVNQDSGTIHEYSLDTYSVTRTLTGFGRELYGSFYWPEENRLIVASAQANTLYVVDVVNWVETRRITNGFKGPHGIELDLLNNRFIICNRAADSLTTMNTSLFL